MTPTHEELMTLIRAARGITGLGAMTIPQLARTIAKRRVCDESARLTGSIGYALMEQALAMKLHVPGLESVRVHYTPCVPRDFYS